MTPPTRQEVDILLITALSDELEPVLQSPSIRWTSYKDSDRYEYHFGTIKNSTGQELGIVAFYTGMGMANASTWLGQLVERWRPKAIAMCGICAGRREKTNQGDVVVANRLYQYDSGKIQVVESESEFLHEIRTSNLDEPWERWIEANRKSWAAAYPEKRPPTKLYQRNWLLQRLLDQAPRNKATEKKHCPDWVSIRTALEADGLVQKSKLELTKKGQREASRFREDSGPRITGEPLKVVIGPLATGNQVVEDRSIFKKLSKLTRSVAGLEMEAVSIGLLADRIKCDGWLVAKAVQDHADEEKDDRYRQFACKVAADLVIFALQGLVTPKRRATKPKKGPLSPTDSGVRVKPAPSEVKLYSTLIRLDIEAKRVFWFYSSLKSHELARLSQLEGLPYTPCLRWPDRKVFAFEDISQLSNLKRQLTLPEGSSNWVTLKKLVETPDGEKTLVALLNSTVRAALDRGGIEYDERHKRYYFRYDPAEKKYTYSSLLGRATHRKTAWAPIAKKTGQRKDYVIHLACAVRFLKTSQGWHITIRPQRHFSKDGETSLTPKKFTQLSTKFKSRMFNKMYLSETTLWSQIIERQVNQHCGGLMKVVCSLIEASIKYDT